MDTRPIGVFDSGLGGLTAVRQLRRVLPGEDIVYFGDTGRVPYGSRGRDIIVQYARQDIRFLLQQDVKFIIAACGTVSSTYPPEEAARLPVPFTGVVGATARAAVDAARLDEFRVGMFRPVTVWPFPEEALAKICDQVEHIVVAELNYGQMKLEVERVAAGRCEVHHIGKVNGTILKPREIYRAIQEVAR